MKVKELDKTVNLAWSPSSHVPIMLAAGTAAQQLDASFSTSAAVEIYDLNLDEPGLDMELRSSIQSPNRFHKLVWGASGGGGNGVIVGGCDNGRLQMYNASNILAGDEGLLCSPERHTGPVKAIDFNTFQSNLLSTGASDSEIFIWDLNNVKTPMTPGAKSQPAEDVVWLAWNQQVQHILASAFATRCVIWDLRKNEPIIKLSDSNSRVRWKVVAWHPDVATQLCLASEEDSNPVVQLWDLRFATTPIKTLEGHHKGVLSIAWCSQDPDLLVSCSKDSRILCWNPGSAQPGEEIVCEMVTSNQWNFEVSWCPRNPSLIATSSFDGHASVFSLVGGQQQMQTTNKIAESFPGMEQYAEAPVVQPPHHSVVVELRKAPKWLKRPAGASFGFGGKLVTFDSESQTVQVSQVVTEPGLLEQSRLLQQSLASGQLRDICHSKTDPVWTFVAASLEPDYRQAMRTLLGFTQEQLDLQKYTGQAVNSKQADIDGLTDDFSLLSQANANCRTFFQFEGSDEEGRLTNNSSQGMGSFSVVQNNLANQFNSVKSDETSFEKCNSPFKLNIGEDKEGIICRALLAGNIELAVDLCVQERRMTDAIILATTAGPDVLARTQYKYFQQNKNSLSELLSAIVTRDWSQVVSSCDLSSWAEALAAVLAYAADDQLPTLCERLGDRLERDGGPDSRRNSEICFVAAGQLGHLIQNRIATDLSTEALQELVELVLVAKRGELHDGGTADLMDRYAQLLAAQGDFDTALAYLSTSTQEEIDELRERLYVASGQKPYPGPPSRQNSYYQSNAQPGYGSGYMKPLKQQTPSYHQPPLPAASAFPPPANQQFASVSQPPAPIAPLQRKPSITNPLVSSFQTSGAPIPNKFTPPASNFPTSMSFPPTQSSFTSSSTFPPTQPAFPSAQSSFPPQSQPAPPPVNMFTPASSAFSPPPPSQKPVQSSNFPPHPPSSRTPVHFNSETALPPPPASNVPPSTFSRSSPSPSLGGGARKYVADPSVVGGGSSFRSPANTYTPQPFSQPTPAPYNSMPTQPFNQPANAPFNSMSSQSSAGPYNSMPPQPSAAPYNSMPPQPSGGPYNSMPSSAPYNSMPPQPFNQPAANSFNNMPTQTFNPPGAPPPAPITHQPERKPQQFVPQTPAASGWNDPPALSGRNQPKDVIVPSPITHPLFATSPASAHMPHDMSMQGGQGMPPGMGVEGEQQNYGYPPASAPMPGMMRPPGSMPPSQAPPPPAPVAKVAEPPRPKPPLPEEHMYLQTVFDELRNRCTCASNNPQLRRKLDDVARKLEVLYDALRENKMSGATISSLHQLVQLVQSGDYNNALQLHTQLVSGPDFSKISTFMPGLKVLIQSALQLNVYLQ